MKEGKVELEGVEPSSKRGNHKLSTCLSLTSFSSYGRTKAINRNLISLIFILTSEPARTIPDIAAPLYQTASEQELLSDVSSQHLVSR